MGRRPCCVKEGLNRGAWSAWEDKILSNYVELHGEGKWRDLPQRAGLNRCGKSCRLRWMNYLRPDIKRGNISLEEEELIIRLHKLLGNRWSLIAGRLPGRTDNEIKNYWNTNLSKRQPTSKLKGSPGDRAGRPRVAGNSSDNTAEPHPVIRTRAVRCTRVVIPRGNLDLEDSGADKNGVLPGLEPSKSALIDGDGNNFLMDFEMSELLTSDALTSFLRQDEDNGENNNGVGGDFPCCSDFLVAGGGDSDEGEAALSGLLQPAEALELKTIASFLNSEDDPWILENNHLP